MNQTVNEQQQSRSESPGRPAAMPETRGVAERYYRRNRWLGLANGGIFGFVDNVVSPYLVLSLFVNQLGGSNFLVGLLPAIANGGWYFPQFLVSHRLQRLRRKMPVYAGVTVVRVVCYTLLTLITFLIGGKNPNLLLTLYFLFFVAYSFAAGVSGTPFFDVVAKTIPPRERGSFFGGRDLLGAGGALVAGLVINYFLGPQWEPAFPLNFGYIFLLATVAVTLGCGAFTLIVEPSEPVTPPEISFWGQVKAARRVVTRDHTYRRYLTMRLVMTVADIATPFYAIYATRVLGVLPETVGAYIGVSTVVGILTNLIWSRLSDRRGNRIVLLGASAGTVVMPLIALGFGLLPASPALGLPFGILYVVAGIVRPAANIGFPSYLLEVAPAAERSLYVAFTNTLLGIATFIPVIGGLLVDAAGFRAVIILAFLIAAVALWLALSLDEPRTRARRKRAAAAPEPLPGPGAGE